MIDRDDFYSAHRKNALKECDHFDEIERAADAIADALERGQHIEVALSPGNGTRYALLFAPRFCTYQSPGDYLTSSGAGKHPVWFAWVGDYKQYAYPIDLLGRSEPPAPSYIAEKWTGGTVSDDTFVFEALLAEIGARTDVPT